jgi:hypothetical protein
MKVIRVGILGMTLVAGVLSLPKTANGGFVITHQGSVDPGTEGFTSVPFAAPSTAGPIANDLGNPAWSIAGTARSSQLVYLSGALTASQQTNVASDGFTLTMVARAVLGLAPTYDPSTPKVIAAAFLDTGARRFEIVLGLNSSGDTVAVLPTSISGGGSGDGSINAPGPSYTLTGLGNGYHTYVLVQSPATHLADLFVDRVDRLQGYAGHTSFLSNSGLVFGAVSGVQGNFNFVQLAVVPEHSTAMLMLLGIGALALAAVARRRSRLQGA